MSMVIKGMMRVTNEDRQLLSSLAILNNHSFDCQAHKRNPGLVCKPIVPTSARKDFYLFILFFFLGGAPKSETL